MNKLVRSWRKFVVGISGGVVLLVGVIAIPYPGPGWLIVFAGLAILAQEFPWAGRVLTYARKKYDDWGAWIKKQSPLVQSVTFIFTVGVVVATLWLLNVYGYTNDVFKLGQDWVRSPIPGFY